MQREKETSLQIVFLLRFQFSKSFTVVSFAVEALLETGLAEDFSFHGGITSQLQHSVAFLAPVQGRKINKGRETNSIRTKASTVDEEWHPLK